MSGRFLKTCSTVFIVVRTLTTQGGTTTRSVLGETRVAGVVVQRSRRTYGHAINGPIGKAAEGLLYALNSLKLAQGHGIPEEFKARLERLLASQGEGGDHTVAILTHQISWLYSSEKKVKTPAFQAGSILLAADLYWRP